jgi:hypothetical protein
MADQLEELPSPASGRARRLAELPDYLTIEEVAERYRRTVPTVRYWRHTGYGPKGVKVGTVVLYPRASIEAFDRELADGAAAEADAKVSV